MRSIRPRSVNLAPRVLATRRPRRDLDGSAAGHTPEGEGGLPTGSAIRSPATRHLLAVGGRSRRRPGGHRHRRTTSPGDIHACSRTISIDFPKSCVIVFVDRLFSHSRSPSMASPSHSTGFFGRGGRPRPPSAAAARPAAPPPISDRPASTHHPRKSNDDH
jgi:hypothetical protein